MKANMGSADRIIRFILGAVIIALGFYFKSWWGLIGIVPILTGILNFCPAYNLIGVSTKSKVKTEKLKV
ncbi:MAG: DUF2892 domain-containing protein [Ignavibacteria bacterium]|nr:DUF2892 domain-containing protein [Ignavibacteria bacterium]